MSNEAALTRFRTEFNDPNLSDWFVEVGAGMAVTATAGQPLTVTTGTTVNAETRITSVQAFEVPVTASFGFKISQKITNQAFFVELVADDHNDLDAVAAGVDETVVASWRISGTDSVTTTVARAEVRNGGPARSQSANLTVPAETADTVFDISIEEDEVWFYARAVDSTLARTLSYKRDTVAPSPNRRYRLRYRIQNGASAPASSTTFTSLFCLARELQSQQVEMRSPLGGQSAVESLPVAVTNSPAVTLANGTIGASASTSGTSISKVLSAASTNGANIKTTAARVYGWVLTNTTAAVKYVRLFNKASTPTTGTDSPALVVAIPPNASVTYSSTIPISFATGLGIAITGGSADLDNTAVAAGDVVGHLTYA